MKRDVKETLLDAGCSERSAQAVERLYNAGVFSDALHQMRCLRCDLMDELHQSQRRVDCLDYLIWQTEKELNTTTERR
jgi:hypothetical protein